MREPSAVYASTERSRNVPRMTPNGNAASAAPHTGAAIASASLALRRPVDSGSARRPTTPYEAATTKNPRSMPNRGRSTNVAISGPHIAPAVFERPSHPAARMSSATSRLIASPSSVKKTPERSDVEPVRTSANHRIQYHSIAHAPCVSWKPLYEAAERQPAASAAAGRYAAASERRANHRDAANPPKAMPPSTTTRIRLIASVLLDRKSVV